MGILYSPSQHYLLLLYIHHIEAYCVLDFTCFNNNPRININGNNGLLIGGYKSGSDTDASVSFGRTSDTGTGNGLPTGSSERDHHATPARLLYMPNSGGVSRIGAFYTVAQKAGQTERITTIIMAQNSKGCTVCPRKSGYERMCQYLTKCLLYINMIIMYYSHILIKSVATNHSSIGCIFCKI